MATIPPRAVLKQRFRIPLNHAPLFFSSRGAALSSLQPSLVDIYPLPTYRITRETCTTWSMSLGRGERTKRRMAAAYLAAKISCRGGEGGGAYRVGVARAAPRRLRRLAIVPFADDYIEEETCISQARERLFPDELEILVKTCQFLNYLFFFLVLFYYLSQSFELKGHGL